MSLDLATLTRRRLLLAGTAFAALAPMALQAQADYPAKTVTFVCAFPAGSGADILVRYMAQKFQETTGQTVIVENRPGAQSNIAAEFTMRAAPDGYTLFVHAGNSLAGNVHLLKDPPLNPATDLRTIATMHEQYFLITVAADSPYQTLQDLVDDQLAKGDRGSYAFNATAGLILGEELRRITGIQTEPVRYGSSGESVNDILAGHVDFGCHDPAFAIAQVNSGTMRILAVSAGERMPGMPDVPTFREQGIDIVHPGWWGVMVPKELPEDLVVRINAIFNEILSTPDAQKFLEDQGGIVVLSTPEEAQKLMEETVDEWERVVNLIGIEPQ